jgi:hypothetical protein
MAAASIGALIVAGAASVNERKPVNAQGGDVPAGQATHLARIPS